MIVFNVVAATIIFFIQYISFGLYLLRFFKITKLNLTALEKILLATCASIAINSSIFFLGGQVIGVKIYYFSLIPLAIGLSQLKYLFIEIKFLWQQVLNNKFLSLLTFFSILTFYATIAFSWIKVNGDLLIQSGQLHDSAWHIALINQLVKAIPPEHPSDFTLTVTNYHYFYDLIIAGIVKVFNLSTSNLYFQFFPLILSSLLAGSAIGLGKRLGGLITAKYLLFSTFFAGSFAYLIPLFFPNNIWHDSSFWVSQTFGMLVNPQIILSLSFVMIILLLMHISLTEKKNLPKTRGYEIAFQLFLIILIASSLGIKSYSFVVLSFMYGVYLLIKLIIERNLWPIAYGAILTVISLPFLWLITGFNSSSFIYEPLWFINTMVEALDRLNHLEWKFLEDYYRYKKVWYRLWELKARQILIFFIGNLGIRFTGLGVITLLLLKKIKAYSIYVIILIGFLFSSIFPLFFLQRGMVWNSIQFWYYSLIFANIFAAIFLSWIHKKIKNKFLLSFFIIVIVALAVPTVVSVAKIKYFEPEVIPADELLMLEKIKPNDLVVVDPRSNTYFQTSMVSAITGARIVYANPVQLELFDLDDIEREYKILDLVERKHIELKNLYPQAKIISTKKWPEQTEELLIQANGKFYLYQL